MRTKPKAVACFLWCFAFGLTQQASGELVVAEGLAVELFATTGQLSNPASIDIDHRGRVWVGEAVNYRKKDRKGGDRILILEDSDGDGRADKTKVFYQDPDIDGVHGVCVLGNQAIVSAPDRILLLTDTDGDDQADEKKLLFKGKVLRPVHGQHDHAIHAVMFGPDGRLYFNFGNYSAGLWRADGSLAKDAFGNPVNNSRKPFILSYKGAHLKGLLLKSKSLMNFSMTRPFSFFVCWLLASTTSIGDKVVIRNVADGTLTTYQKNNFKERLDAGSLMPPGITASLDTTELRDLIKYLSNLKSKSFNKTSADQIILVSPTANENVQGKE